MDDLKRRLKQIKKETFTSIFGEDLEEYSDRPLKTESTPIVPKLDLSSLQKEKMSASSEEYFIFEKVNRANPHTQQQFFKEIVEKYDSLILDLFEEKAKLEQKSAEIDKNDLIDTLIELEALNSVKVNQTQCFNPKCLKISAKLNNNNV